MSFGKVSHILLYGIPSRLKPALPVCSFRRCKKKNIVLLLLVIIAKVLTGSSVHDVSVANFSCNCVRLVI